MTGSSNDDDERYSNLGFNGGREEKTDASGWAARQIANKSKHLDQTGGLFSAPEVCR